jgi:FkbM family methyltransferase
MPNVTLENKFKRAVGRLYASPIRKVAIVGPRRFLKRRYARFFGLGSEQKAELFFGGAMTVVLPEVISEQIYTYGLFDEIVTGLVMRAVRKGDIVLDIGAHFGYFTLLFSHLVEEAGRVVSFEPTPSTFAVLTKNANSASNVTALNLAAGHQDGHLTISDFGLTYSAWNTLSASSRMPEKLKHPKARLNVQVIKLDDWCDRESIQPTFIKIDAENFETEVIAGLRNTLSRFMPHVLMETGSKGAVEAGRTILALDYQMLVSTEPGVLTVQHDHVEEALMKNKDVLFVASAKIGELMGRE